MTEEAAREMDLASGIPVVIGGSDGALNQIGAGAMEEGIMTLSVGTSGALRLASKVPVIPQEPSTWCYYLADGKRIAGAATAGAGNCVEWFVKRLNSHSGLGFSELEAHMEAMIGQRHQYSCHFSMGRGVQVGMMRGKVVLWTQRRTSHRRYVLFIIRRDTL